jgi:glucose dehydrogenase
MESHELLFRGRFTRRHLLAGAGGAAAFAGIGTLISRSGGLAQNANPNQQPATPTAAGPAIPPEVSAAAGDWPVPTGDYLAHRAASNSTISTSTVSQLAPAWSVPINVSSGFGAMTCVPLVLGDTVYLQDMMSNVYAIDRASGQAKWTTKYNLGTEGPNGVAVGYGLVFGSIGNTSEVFALKIDTGEQVWRIKLTNNDHTGVDMAPTVYNNIVYISTVPGNGNQFYRGGGRGILYALDAQTGVELWEFDTTTDNLWGNPAINSGGGLWYPPSVDGAGNIYFGVGNAAPWPGTVANGTPYPNGSSRPGDNLYSSSMVSLDPKSGAVRWYVQSNPHDLFDLDFQLTPILIEQGSSLIAVGSGKAGNVIAADANTGKTLWKTPVGVHKNDTTQSIPAGQTIEVEPAALGGTETPMAFADGVVFAPVVNLPMKFTDTALDSSSVDLTAGSGELVAINVSDGSVKWDTKLPTAVYAGAVVANDVVFTSGLDGIVRGFKTADGSLVWSWQAPAGLNAPLAIAGDLLLVPAGGPLVASSDSTPTANKPASALVALSIGGKPTTGASGTPGATPAS